MALDPNGGSSILFFWTCFLSKLCGAFSEATDLFSFDNLMKDSAVKEVLSGLNHKPMKERTGMTDAIIAM